MCQRSACCTAAGRPCKQRKEKAERAAQRKSVMQGSVQHKKERRNFMGHLFGQNNSSELTPGISIPRIMGGCIGAYAAKHITVGSCSLVSAWHLASINVCASQRSRAEHPGGFWPVVLKEAKCDFAFYNPHKETTKKRNIRRDQSKRVVWSVNMYSPRLFNRRARRQDSSTNGRNQNRYTKQQRFCEKKKKKIK